jgi:penicillin G amidase
MSGQWLVRLRRCIVLLGVAWLSPSVSHGANATSQSLFVNGERVRIQRDAYGVPQIKAETNRGLFEAYGYVIAQDRLFQLEVNRRAGRGTLAQIFGPTLLAMDRNTRRLGYTDAELDEQFATLSPDEQEIYSAYADGINRYIAEVVVPDPAHKLPFEFQIMNLGLPAPWTTRDIVAFQVFQARSFLERGDQERVAQTLLSNLIASHGPTDGRAIFNDVQWLHDPDAPATVPEEGAIGKKAHPITPATASQLEGGAEVAEDDGDIESMLASVGVATTLGSHAWVIGPGLSGNGRAMLFGGPQLAPAASATVVPTAAPAQVHEVELQGGDGFHVRGMALAGVPIVVLGRNDHIAWTETTALNANNVDTYIETVCGGGTGYLYQGACVPFETRTEVIKVKGAPDDILVVERTVHGPVTASAPGVRFSRKSVQRNRELENGHARLAMCRAHNVQEFEAAVHGLVGSGNILFADKRGNIAYWRAGEIPVRPDGFDLRLPLPGDGSAEWTGERVPIPTSINPTQGWLANWNTKATVDEECADPNISTGKQQRVLDIEDRLQAGPLSLADFQDIARDIARVDKNFGRLSRYLRPYLLQSLDAVPSNHPLAAQARAVVESWSGNKFADAVASTTREPGDVIFTTWLDLMLPAVFADELGADVSRATPNMLIHVLDDALGGGSGVPPSRDYFNGQDPHTVVSNVFTQALNTLGPSPTGWSNKPRDVVHFRHMLSSVPEIGTIFDSNRGTYAQMVAFSSPLVDARNIFPLGQSGFIAMGPGNTPVFDEHFSDQLTLYRNFEYKPMSLTKSGASGGTLPEESEASDVLQDGIMCAVTPNPSDGPVHVAFTLPKVEPVRIGVYDIGGREIARLVDGSLPAGRHDLDWKAGKLVRSGVYLVRLEREGTNVVRRIVVRK